MAVLPAILPVRRSVELIPAPPYDFKVALAYVATSPSAVLERASADEGTYRRAVALLGRDILLSLRSIGDVSQPRLVLDIHGDTPIDDALESAAISLVRHIFTLDVDAEVVSTFANLAERDPIFGTLLRRLHSIRPILIPDPFEALIWAVIGQQINVTFARKLKLALVDLCSRHLATATGTYALAPEPADIAALDAEQLHVSAVQSPESGLCSRTLAGGSRRRTAAPQSCLTATRRGGSDPDTLQRCRSLDGGVCAHARAGHARQPACRRFGTAGHHWTLVRPGPPRQRERSASHRRELARLARLGSFLLVVCFTEQVDVSW